LKFYLHPDVLTVAYGFGDKAQRFGNEASLENTDGLPEFSLLRDPTLAYNGLHSFLGGDRGEKLSNLLGLEQASLYSQQALKSLVEGEFVKRGEPDQEHLVWALIHAVIGDLPPYEDLANRLKDAVRQTNFVDLTRSNAQTGMFALHTASQLVLNLGEEDLRGHLKEQLVGVAGLLAEQDDSRSDRPAGVKDLTKRAEMGAFMDAALTLAVATNLPQNTHLELAALIDRLVSVWPSTAPLFKLIALRFCEQLPVLQSKHYWPFLIRLRAE
jgi:hypothetical protein